MVYNNNCLSLTQIMNTLCSGNLEELPVRLSKKTVSSQIKAKILDAFAPSIIPANVALSERKRSIENLGNLIKQSNLKRGQINTYSSTNLVRNRRLKTNSNLSINVSPQNNNSAINLNHGSTFNFPGNNSNSNSNSSSNNHHQKSNTQTTDLIIDKNKQQELTSEILCEKLAELKLFLKAYKIKRFRKS